jgi:hypothetical protein
MRYLIQNAVANTTAAPVKVATGTAIKTMLQIKSGATTALRVVEWGISFDGAAAATPIAVEFVETDVAATVTTLAAADITKYDAEAIAAGDPTTALIAVGTAATGFTATAEGSSTVARNLDGPQLIAPTNQYVKQFPLGERPLIQSGKFLRVRVTAGTSVNAYCYVIVEV